VVARCRTRSGCRRLAVRQLRKPDPPWRLDAAIRFMKEAGAHAVKLEGGERVAEQIATLTAAGIPVMAHIGFTRKASTPWAVSGCRAAGTPPSRPSPTPIAVAEAGAFSVVMEMVAGRVGHPDHRQADDSHRRDSARGPTATPRCWCGRTWPVLTSGKTARFVKRFGDVGGELHRAATQYAQDVAAGVFPADEHSF